MFLSNISELTNIYSALPIGAQMKIDFESDFDFGNDSCHCQTKKRGQFPLDFTLDYFYEKDEKELFLERRKTDLENYYKRNYFQQIGSKGKISKLSGPYKTVKILKLDGHVHVQKTAHFRTTNQFWAI